MNSEDPYFKNIQVDMHNFKNIQKDHIDCFQEIIYGEQSIQNFCRVTRAHVLYNACLDNNSHFQDSDT